MKKRLCVKKKSSKAISLALVLMMFASALCYGLGASDVAMASSANPHPRQALGENGKMINYKVLGDERFSVYVDSKGKVIYQDPEDGIFKLAKKDGRAITPKELQSKADKEWYYHLWAKTYDERVLSEDRKVVSVDQLNSYGDFGPKAVSRRVAAKTKVIPMLNIVVGFSDCKYSNSYDWSKTIFESQYGITSFYDQESYGKVQVVPAKESCKSGKANTNGHDRANDGVCHVNLNRKHGNWQNDFANKKKMKNLLACFNEAISKADKYVDFAKYDVDNNGVLLMDELAINFIMAGYEASSCDRSPAIWAHQYSLFDLAFDNGADMIAVDSGIQISDYITVGEKSVNGIKNEKVEQTSVATLTHEFGHLLGLPDLYDTRDQEQIWEDGHWVNYDVELLSLMARGNWAIDNDGRFRATHLDPYSRYSLGFIKPKVILTDSQVDVASRDSAEGYNSYIIPTKKKGEYFILENRQARGFDEGLREYYYDYYNKDQLGIMMWHIDESIIDKYGYYKANQVNASNHRPGVMPVFDEDFDAFRYYPFNNPQKQAEGYKWNAARYNGNKIAARVDSGIDVVPVADKGANGTVITTKIDFDESVVSFVPGKVAVLKASYSKGKVALKWSRAKHSPDGYRVYVSKSPDGKFKPLAYIKKPSAKAFAHKVKGAKGESVYYKVRAYKNTFGIKKWGEFSPVAQVEF